MKQAALGRLRILEVLLERSNREPQQGCQQGSAVLRFAFQRDSPWQQFGDSAAVVLALCLVGSLSWDREWWSPRCILSAMRAGSCENICTEHEDGIWRQGRAESRDGNETNNGFFKHLFYSPSKWAPSLNPADAVLLCAGPPTLEKGFW